MEMRLDRVSAQPLYAQIRDAFRQRIREGTLKPGQQLPPVRRIAQECGVSLLTVTRALADLARQGVISCRQGSGCYVNALAEEAAIEVIIPGHQPRTAGMIAFHEQLFAGLRSGAEPRACRLWVSYLDGRAPSARELADVAAARRLTGLVAYHPSPDVMATLQELAAEVPTAALRPPALLPGLDCVVPDPADALQRVLRRRIEAGARTFAFIGYAQPTSAGGSPYDALFQVFVRTVAECGAQPFVHIAPEGLADPHWNMDKVNAYLFAAARSLPDGCVILSQTQHIGESLTRADMRFDVISYTENRATLDALQGRMSLLYVGLETLACAAARMLLNPDRVRQGRTERLPAQVFEASEAWPAQRQGPEKGKEPLP